MSLLYRKDVQNLGEIALSQKEISTCTSSRILPLNYNYLTTGFDLESVQKDQSIYFYVDLGCFYGKYHDFDRTGRQAHICVVKDFLIVSDYNKNAITIGSAIKNDYTNGDIMWVIPLCRVTSYAINSEQFDVYTAPVFEAKAGSPIKGAIVGGIIAGSTGAVIGAIASSQPKIKITRLGGVSNYNRHRFSITFKNKITLENEEDNILKPNPLNIISHNGGIEKALEQCTDFDLRIWLMNLLKTKGIEANFSPYVCSEKQIIDLYMQGMEHGIVISDEIDSKIIKLEAPYKKIDSIKQEISAMEEETQDLHKELKNLGILNFKGKRELKSNIENLRTAILEKEKEIKTIKCDRIQDVISFVGV